MSITRTRRLIRLIIIVVVILMIISFAVNRFFIQPLNRMITTNYHLVPFTQAYMAERDQSITVEIPQAFELFHMLYALAEERTQQTQMLNRSTDYWHDAAGHFASYMYHPAVNHVEQLVKNRSLEALGRAFTLDIDDGYLVGREAYHDTDYLTMYGVDHRLIEDFIAVSGYAFFHTEMEAYYEYETELFQELVPIDRMRDWLESHFSISHQSYRVVLSPLMLGTQYTYLFRENKGDWSEIVMCVPTVNQRYVELAQQGVITAEQLEAFASLLLFTEIDHNYVNPATDAFLHRLRSSRIFADRSSWYMGMGYNGASLIFNEYMTWGLYGLYCYDSYSEDTAKSVIQTLNSTMEQRGFVRFPQFMEGLLDVYMNSADDGRIEDYYGEILSMASRLR